MSLEELEEIALKAKQEAAKFDKQISICVGTACLAVNSDKLKEAVEAEVAKCGIEKCNVRGVGCKGLCSAGPLVSIEPSDAVYKELTQADAPELVKVALGKEGLVEKKLNQSDSFFAKQTKVVLENAGYIDPEKIEEYIARDGYTALLTALTQMTTLNVIDEVRTSGLRGRGGGGYPTGLKWQTVAKSAGEQKYVVCNADEGDPGAFMDRSVLEADPHRVLEGMAIAAYAVGANKGYIYVRAEYPLAVKMLKTAIKQAEKMGLLGQNIGGTNFSFHVEIRLGAGAFVCGEETALLNSIEGKRGMPNPRPPYPAVKGLFGKPTLINNVETYANIAPIIRNGGAWYAGIGTSEKSKGTKVFALTGNIKNAGIVEVPMGMTVREIVFDIGGGTPEGRNFKAVQTGGPSGGCIPEQHLDSPVDYDSLIALGTMMGSGGMIVIDDSSSMPEIAKFFMDFCVSESCGKCTPCRVGTVEMYKLLEKFTTNTATKQDLELLEELCHTVRATSLCGLGQSAPNPVLSTLKYFKDEYLSKLGGDA